MARPLRVQGSEDQSLRQTVKKEEGLAKREAETANQVNCGWEFGQVPVCGRWTPGRVCLL